MSAFTEDLVRKIMAEPAANLGRITAEKMSHAEITRQAERRVGTVSAIRLKYFDKDRIPRPPPGATEEFLNAHKGEKRGWLPVRDVDTDRVYAPGNRFHHGELDVLARRAPSAPRRKPARSWPSISDPGGSAFYRAQVWPDFYTAQKRMLIENWTVQPPETGYPDYAPDIANEDREAYCGHIEGAPCGLCCADVRPDWKRGRRQSPPGERPNPWDKPEFDADSLELWISGGDDDADNDNGDVASFESWAANQCGARRFYGAYARTGDAGALRWGCKEHPKGTMSCEECRVRHQLKFLTDHLGRWYRKGYEPHKTFLDVDRERQRRAAGRQADDIGGGPSVGEVVDTADDHDSGRHLLLDLHVATNGGYSIDPRKAARDQIEVCRYRKCGKDLGLPRDELGYVIRNPGAQPEYCSDRCEADADNERDRQERAGTRGFPRDLRHCWWRGADHAWHSSWYAERVWSKPRRPKSSLLYGVWQVGVTAPGACLLRGALDRSCIRIEAPPSVTPSPPWLHGVARSGRIPDEDIRELTREVFGHVADVTLDMVPQLPNSREAHQIGDLITAC